MFVVLRPGLPTAHLAKCIDALMSIAEHDPNCPKQPRECMDMTRLVALQILLGHESIAMSLHYAGQAAATARRGARQYSPVAKLGLHLGKRLQRGRPKKGSLS